MISAVHRKGVPDLDVGGSKAKHTVTFSLSSSKLSYNFVAYRI